MEGETKLARGYRYCGECGRGFFPLDEQLKLSAKSWSPETIRNAVRLGVEMASYERAAATFEASTRMPMSKSYLQRLVTETGDVLVAEQEAEAQAMVQAPRHEEEVVWRACVRLLCFLLFLWKMKNPIGCLVSWIQPPTTFILDIG